MNVNLQPGSAAPADVAIARGNVSAKGAPRRLSAAAKEFESILVNQWLQGAESSFGAAPGGNDDDDAGGGQMKGFATQQLAQAISSKAGIGISALVQHGLAQLASPRRDASIDVNLQTKAVLP